VPCVACVASGWKPALTDASHQTFHIFTMQHYAKRGICRRRVSVCLSVTLRYCIKTAKHRITQIMPHDSSGNLVFCCQKSLRNSKGITPYGSDKCRWGGLQVALLWQRDRATRLSVEILQLQNIPIVWHYLRDPTFSRFYTIPECDRHTHRNGQTDTRRRHVLR